MDVAQFLQSTITTPSGYLCIALRSPNVAWHEIFIKWPDEIDKAMKIAYDSREEYDVYFTSYLFNTPDSSSKENVLPSCTIQADLDSADIRNLPLKPGTLVKTSPGRYQAYWYIDPAKTTLSDDDANLDIPHYNGVGIDLELHELLSRRLTYAIHDADRSGWSLGHKVRVADTYNHKYIEGMHLVEVIDHDPRRYTVGELELLPDVDSITLNRFDSEFITNPPTDPKLHPLGPNELLVQIRSKIPLQVYVGYNQQATDRSIALWALMCACFRAGLDRNDVFWLALHSANNKFARLHYHSDRELAKDVLRAEHEVFTIQSDPRSIVSDLRKSTLDGPDTKRAVMGFVFNHMKEEGDFIKTATSESWYVPRDTGRPVFMSQRNEGLDSLLDIRYNLNRTESEHEFTVFGVMNQLAVLQPNGVQAALSYFDQNSTTLYVHTGRKDVVVLRPNEPHTIMTDGTRGIVFPWDIHAPFNPFPSAGQPLLDWGKYLFGDMHNVTDITPSQAVLLLKVWFMFILFREAAQAKPILALLGQPGCLGSKVPVDIQRGSRKDYVCIEELYRKFHGGISYSRAWDSTIPTQILSLKDGAIQYRNIHDVIKSGTKVTYTVIAGDRILRATAEHQFLTPEGFKKLSDLKVGDIVYTRSLARVKAGKRVQAVRHKVSVKYHPYGQVNVINGVDYPRIYRSKAVYEANLNGLSLEQYLHILNYDAEKSLTLKFIDKDANVHHKDENHNNEAIDNLELQTRVEHSRLHGDKAKYRFGNFDTKGVRITSIEYYGEEETYDIVMEDQEAPNFLANGIIVHNSSKTTIGHRVHTMLYGPYAGLLGVTNQNNFDQSTATKPLVMLDNVDTWEPWLPDRLAQAAASTDIDKRKLYSDADTVRMRRQAMVALTAHNPKFSREDITDRLLLVNMLRLEKFEPEGIIIDAVRTNRNRLWQAVIEDAQRVINKPLPTTTTIRFRIADFARIGEWIADGLGQREEFQSLMGKLSTSQVTHNLQTDQVLVGAMIKYASTGGTKGNYKNQQELFSILQMHCSSNDVSTFSKIYKNQMILGKKLWTLLESLRSLMHLEFAEGNAGSRLWKVGPLELNNGK